MKATRSTATDVSGSRISHLLPITPYWGMMLSKSNRYKSPTHIQLFYILFLYSNMNKPKN